MAQARNAGDDEDDEIRSPRLYSIFWTGGSAGYRGWSNRTGGALEIPRDFFELAGHCFWEEHIST